MILPSKKLAAIASVVGGLAYLSQHYTIDGLHRLRIEPVSRSGSLPVNSTYPSASSAPFSNWEQSTGYTGSPSNNYYPSNSSPGNSSPGNSQPGNPTSGSAFSNWFPSITKSVSTFTSTPSPHAESANQSNGTSTRGMLQLPPSQSSIAQPPLLRAPTIKIASFNLQHFGHHKVENPFVAETVIKVIRQFDVIALQEICTQQQDLVATVIDRVNQTGHRYDYVIGPRVGTGDNLEQFAFVFNTQTIETDRDQLYSVEDPDNLLLRDPLVGWFRAKQSDAQKAFTFTLVNVHCSSERADAELRLLPELVQSIRRDGRDEDDVILAGDFGADALSMAYLRQKGFTVTLTETPSLVTGSKTPDNLVLTSKATDEYIGRAGTLDFLRKSNLSIDQALQVSDHLPIWAEFSTVEGGAY